mgnify:CR=1 FL=1
MALNRRNFLRATLAGAAVAAGSSAFAACGGKAASTEGCPAEKDHVQTAKRVEDILSGRDCTGS